MVYTTKITNNYRVPTVEEALKLRAWLQKNSVGELTSFSYTTKYIKQKGEIVEEYQSVKAVITVDNEKEPEGIMPINITEDRQDD